MATTCADPWEAVAPLQHAGDWYEPMAYWVYAEMKQL
jgi:hypothetical protein